MTENSYSESLEAFCFLFALVLFLVYFFVIGEDAAVGAPGLHMQPKLVLMISCQID
jgi:hypothetical protein